MRFQQQKWQQDKTSLLRQAADEARNLLSSASEQAERKAEETESKSWSAETTALTNVKAWSMTSSPVLFSKKKCCIANSRHFKSHSKP
jgi:hypothetical protein